MAQATPGKPLVIENRNCLNKNIHKAASKSTEKLSSGYRINRAADDAAGLTISEKMRKQIKGLDRASTNAEDGVSAVQTAEGALTEVHSMLQRMNELATQSANGTNSNTDRKAIQDEIDQLTTEIDRVSETTKFNETYLLKGDGAEKAHNVNAHDAGLDGVTLTDKGDEVEVTLKELKAGDKISIAGKNYTIGATAADAQKIVDAQKVDGKTVTVNGTTYTYKTNQWTNADGSAATVGGGAAGSITIKGGDVVSDGTKTLTAMKDGADAAGADGIDDNDSTVISAGKAYQLQTAEIVKASSIGSDTAATVKANAGNTNANYANATTTFTLTKGTVSYKDSLSFNLHVGADADMTNKITVNIDSMNSAGLGVKGIKADTEQVSVIQIWLKRWLTTARTTFLHRLDSLCLHRLISQTRVYFHSYSNHLQFNVVQSRKSSKGLFLLCTFFF